MRPRVCIPQPLEPRRYKSHILLLRSTDKYITGFFDSLSGRGGATDVGNQLAVVESVWQRLLNSCQGMLALMRKGKYFVRPDASLERPLSKREKHKAEIRLIRTAIERTLEERVFSRLDGMTKHCSPFALSHFWSVCRILLDLSRQLGYARGALVARFLHSLHLSLDLADQSTDRGFADVIKHLEHYFVDDLWDENKHSEKHNQIGDDDRPQANGRANGHQSGRKENAGPQENQDDGNPTGNEDEGIWTEKPQEYLEKQRHTRKIRKEKRQQEIKESQACHAETNHIIRTSYQGAAKAFSTRRRPTDPHVLRMWADYCRQWDTSALDTEEFLKGYQEAFRETELSYGSDHNYTIDVLCNYATAAYYICHAKDLAHSLATDLWERTCDACYGQPPTWSAKARGMAEAARILGLSVCIYHENMHKDSDTRRKIRKELGLRKKKNRPTWRQTLGPPPPPHRARDALICLNRAVQSLATGDWDCRIVAQDMAYSLRALLLNFCWPGEPYEQVAVGSLERGNECLARIFSEAEAVPGMMHMALDTEEKTIDPAQLLSRP